MTMSITIGQFQITMSYVRGELGRDGRQHYTCPLCKAGSVGLVCLDPDCSAHTRAVHVANVTAIDVFSSPAGRAGDCQIVVYFTPCAGGIAYFEPANGTENEYRWLGVIEEIAKADDLFVHYSPSGKLAVTPSLVNEGGLLDGEEATSYAWVAAKKFFARR